MSVTKVRYGRPVKLLIDFQGFPDGRIVQFEIWRRRDGKEEKVFEVYGVTKGGKGIGEWDTPFKERKESLPLEKTATQQTQQEKYFFIAKIDDKEAKSPDMEFTYSLEIYVEDVNGKPLSDVKYTVTLSDGSKKNDVVRNGRIKIEDAPAGKFTVELEGYDFIFT
jgi:hypothetical protein